ncbi:Hypothetical predicted protein, partial [Lynx pardinus]
KSMAFIRKAAGGSRGSRCNGSDLPGSLHHHYPSEIPQEESDKAFSGHQEYRHGECKRCHEDGI